MIVYKYELSPGLNNLELPTGSKLLSVQAQGSGEHAMLWALLPENWNVSTRVTRVIKVVPTGLDFEATNPVYISTFQFSNGLVFHAFEVSP